MTLNKLWLLLVVCFGLPAGLSAQQHSVARLWNEAQLLAIRNDFARPPVHARNLWHVSVGMYDAWAAYDQAAQPFLIGNTVGTFMSPFDGVQTPDDVDAARNEAISFAAYRILRHRFQFSPGASSTLLALNILMADLGYDINHVDTEYASGNPASLGNYIAEQIIAFGLSDGSNEQGEYTNTFYLPLNLPLDMTQPGNPDMADPNRWQPLELPLFIDQAGNPFTEAPAFQSPEWGYVTPFALADDDLNVYSRDGQQWPVYLDPGPPPLLDTLGPRENDELYRLGFSMVSVWQSHLDPNDGVMWDISPASIGNLGALPSDILDELGLYHYYEGGDIGTGHALNPKTSQAYAPQWVPRGDYTRILAEFWADGPASETPPGHWYSILNYVSDHPEFEPRWMGEGNVLDPLEWDVKAYFTLGGAVHDAAIAAWSVKGWFDYPRPVSAIRYMADRGQNTDPDLPSYHVAGIPLMEGHIELVEPGDPVAGNENEHVGKIKLFTWRGPDYIEDPEVDLAGVGWILAENWWPYQRPTFVTPPFAGYVSGHSTFSRAAAEALTFMTGDAYFPGGMGEFYAPQGAFLEFENGPSTDITLQWATYRDASDQCSLSRIWGGIHPPADDIPGRRMGLVAGQKAFHKATSYFGIIPPEAENIEVSTPLINRDMIGDVFIITVHFSQAMNTDIAPEVSFSNQEVLPELLFFIQSDWADAQTYEQVYVIIDAAVELEVNSATVEGGEGANGMTMVPADFMNLFSVDLIAPEVAWVQATPTLAENEPVTLTIGFTEPMDTSLPPELTFDAGGTTFEEVEGSALWLNSIEFSVTVMAEVALDDSYPVDVFITSVSDVSGNQAEAYSALGLFTIAGASVVNETTLTPPLVYPNPLGGNRILNVAFNEPTLGEVAIFASDGRQVALMQLNGSVLSTLELGRVASGVYSVVVRSETSQHVVRIVLE